MKHCTYSAQGELKCEVGQNNVVEHFGDRNHPNPYLRPPPGSYRKSCFDAKHCYVDDVGDRHMNCWCMDGKGRNKHTGRNFNLNDCMPGSDISNNFGKLQCVHKDSTSKNPRALVSSDAEKRRYR